MTAKKPETWPEMLQWLAENSVAVSVSFNDHRTIYQTPAQHYDADDFSSVEVMRECTKRDTCVAVQCYADTPIGSYVVVHYDVAVAVAEVFESVWTGEERGR